MSKPSFACTLVLAATFGAACLGSTTDDAAETTAEPTATSTSAATDAATTATTDAASTTTAPSASASVAFRWWHEEAPVHVVVAQGPTAEAERYALVTWDHAVSDAVGYEIERDGTVIGAVELDAEPWNDVSFRDDGVAPGAHDYRVRALRSDGPGPWSEAASLTVRSDADLGPVFVVDDYTGDDLTRAQRAVDAATDAGGGIVQFGAATYTFDDSLLIAGDGVVLRGAGQDETVLRVGFAGGEESCGRVTPLLLFRGRLGNDGAVLAERAPIGSTVLVFDRTPDVSVGDVVYVDGTNGQLPTYEYTERGIAQDPTIENDERYSFDMATVVAVDGARVTLDHPVSQHLVVGAELWVQQWGFDNGVELLSVEGSGPDAVDYHRLIDIGDQVRFRLAEVEGRWANRNMIDAYGMDISLVGFSFDDGGAAGYRPEACKYKVGIGPATDVTVLGSSFGSTEHERNMSLLTIQFTNRAVIRASTFGGSTTYGFNEHGGGSRDIVFENNFVSAGPDSWGGILLGNDTWGFSGPMAIRNNQFVANPVDVYMVENPTGVSVVANHSVGCTDACLLWGGWGEDRDGATAIDDPARWGSAQLTVADNVFTDAASGARLGIDESAGFPHEGIRDLYVVANTIEASGAAIELVGSADATGRLVILGNDLTGAGGVGGVASQTPGADWVVSDDADPSAEPDWARAYLPWETK